MGIKLDDVQRGYDAWAAKPHNAKWVRKIDGTPIANDIVVTIFDTLRDLSAIDLEAHKALIAAKDAEQSQAVENERLRFEGDLDKWMKIIGAGITGFQPEAYAIMDLACEELVRARAEIERLRNKVSARALTDKQLSDEISAVDAVCAGGFGEGGGSPGEWWYERADELEHERKRRELESQLSAHNRAALNASEREG